MFLMHFRAFFVIYHYVKLVTSTGLIIRVIENTLLSVDKRFQCSTLLSMLTDFKKQAHLGAILPNIKTKFDIYGHLYKIG